MRSAPLIFLLLIQGLFLFGQSLGESKVSSINLKKPSASIDGGSRENQVYNDTIAPRIEIISPQVDTMLTIHIASSSSYLIGRLSDPSGISSFTINDQSINISEDGFFQEIYELADGLNVFKLEASDQKSNTVSQILYIIQDGRQESSTGSDTFECQGNFHGLIIGVNNYSDSALIDLDHPITDATFLYSVLMGNYTFEPAYLTLLRDPTRADIIMTLDRLSRQLTPKDNLLIFYAGHGHWDEERETGYWMPSDAHRSSSVNWIRNSTIQDYVEDMNTQHTLLISDACFAGSILKTRSAFEDASMAINKLYSLPSRKAMTSGTLKEVPDKSVFIEYFLKRLLHNDRMYISSGQLFYDFREAVLNNSPNVPQYGVIQDAGDEGGEFIFVRRN